MVYNFYCKVTLIGFFNLNSWKLWKCCYREVHICFLLALQEFHWSNISFTLIYTLEERKSCCFHVAKIIDHTPSLCRQSLVFQFLLGDFLSTHSPGQRNSARSLPCADGENLSSSITQGLWLYVNSLHTGLRPHRLTLFGLSS